MSDAWILAEARNAGILCKRDEKILLDNTDPVLVLATKRNLQAHLEEGHAFQTRCERSHP